MLESEWYQNSDAIHYRVNYNNNVKNEVNNHR